MAALTGDTAATILRDNELFSFPAAAATQFYKGGLVAINASNVLVKASLVAGLKVVGVCQDNVNNSAGANGALQVPVRRGLFRFTNAGTFVLADIGTTAYIADDQSVNKTSASNSAVGIVRDVDSAGVWVEI